MKPRIHILATGGTIAATSETVTGDRYGDAKLKIDRLLADTPQINDFAQISFEQIVQIDSSQMTQQIWLQLAKRAQAILEAEDVDGIVITHGTDTAEETAYFLNLVLKTHKPVIITGAMRPSESLSADGVRNLYNAIVLACCRKAQAKGVLLTFNDNITNARDVTKTNVSSSDSFRSYELGLLGYINGRETFFYKQPTTKHTFASQFNLSEINHLPKVDIIYGYVDCDPCLVKSLVQNKAQGIISAGLGKGLQSPAITKALALASQQDIIVVRSSHVGNGVVAFDPSLDGHYQFVAGNTLNPQKARILLSLALTQTKDRQEIQKIFDEY